MKRMKAGMENRSKGAKERSGHVNKKEKKDVEVKIQNITQK